ncbi:MAG: hypothetical protein DRR08_13135 [Candidatus Parabeggiatoa sp. nov. 2]|nr:MAG: hypothetical protein B6247_05835 [Beggiatoa sp. 4572_84]RKZ59731.1 MAG: hypothetical protein DRR08_13135 [Gammaproteobacteria bacterium]
MVSSITQTKAEVQKLIKLYNQLQQEAKTAPTEEAARKVAQAEKLVSQINTLQSALSKTKAIDPATAANTARTAKTATTPSATSTNKGIKRTDLAEEKRAELEQRIGRIEVAQKNTRAKIEQLNVAKAELERLQIEAEKNAVQLEHRAKEKRQPQAQELAKLNDRIQSREAQYQSLKKELDTVRQQAQKDAELLKEQRDAAVERQKQLEKEKMSLLRYGGSSNGFLNGLLIGVGVGVLCIAALAVVIFKTPWLDEAVCLLKDYPTECSFSQTTNNDTTKQSAKQPPVERQQ